MHGIIIIDKPEGITSHDVVHRVRKILHIKKVGHTGTLDPLATGVLPICIGQGTRIAEYLTAETKAYEATIKFGSSTTTEDAEGEVVKTCALPSADLEKVHKVLNSFVGDIEQTPPIYSAIKVQGKPLYFYARNNIPVDIPKRRVHIQSIDLLAYSKEYLRVKVVCSKGTYIRSLLTSIAQALESCGHIIALCRMQNGTFTITDALSFEDLTAESIRSALIPIDQVLPHMPSVYIDTEEALQRLKNGNIFAFPENQYKEYAGLVKLYANRTFVGIGKKEKDTIYPHKLLFPEVISF